MHVCFRRKRERERQKRRVGNKGEIEGFSLSFVMVFCGGLYLYLLGGSIVPVDVYHILEFIEETIQYLDLGLFFFFSEFKV